MEQTPLCAPGAESANALSAEHHGTAADRSGSVISSASAPCPKWWSMHHVCVVCGRGSTTARAFRTRKAVRRRVFRMSPALALSSRTAASAGLVLDSLVSCCRVCVSTGLCSVVSPPAPRAITAAHGEAVIAGRTGQPPVKDFLSSLKAAQATRDSKSTAG